MAIVVSLLILICLNTSFQSISMSYVSACVDSVIVWYNSELLQCDMWELLKGVLKK